MNRNVNRNELSGRSFESFQNTRQKYAAIQTVCLSKRTIVDVLIQAAGEYIFPQVLKATSIYIQ